MENEFEISGLYDGVVREDGSAGSNSLLSNVMLKAPGFPTSKKSYELSTGYLTDGVGRYEYSAGIPTDEALINEPIDIYTKISGLDS